MNLKEFEHQVLAGEITDFEPYFEDKDINYHLRYVLAKLGIEVDRIIEMDGPGTILGFIKDKVHIDRYKEWKDYPLVYIRQALARAGYFEDEYFDDPDESVRGIVIQNNVRKALTHIRSDNDLAFIKNQLFNIVEFDIDILSAYINKEKQYARKYQYDFNDSVNNIAFQLKLDAINHIPTTIEKTMSPSQLYASNSPLWANNYIGITIERILRQLEKKPRTVKSFNNTISELRIDQPTMFDEFHNIGATK